MNDLHRNRFLSAPLAVLLVGVVLFSGCLSPEQQMEQDISDIIEGGNSVRSEVLSSSEGVFSDYRVYRDGEQNGVVFEYVYSPGTFVDRAMATPEFIKGEMMKEFGTDPDAQRILKSGVYLRFLYKQGDDVITDAKITGDDL